MTVRFGTRTALSITVTAVITLLGACSSDSNSSGKTGAAGAGAKAGAGGGTAGAAGGAAGSNTDGGMDASLNSKAARGQYLVNAVIACSDCHTPQGANGPDMTKFLAGNPNFVQTPGGNLGTPNLTNDATGLKNFTDQQIKDMFLNGTRPTPDGGIEALNPIMPYYVFHNMDADDADAIVAYLRTVPGVNNTIPRRAAMFDVPVPAAPLNLANVPKPMAAYPNTASATRGQYLATQAGVCVECHTKHLAPGSATVLDEAHMFEGGEDFSQLFATSLMIHPVSLNITSDPTTGIGTWTVDQIKTVLLQGKDDMGSGICPPMPVGPNGAYGHLMAQDATDIANYIHSLPPKVNNVPDMCSWPAMPMDGGAAGAGGHSGGGAGGGAAGAGGGAAGAAGHSGGGAGGAAGASAGGAVGA